MTIPWGLILKLGIPLALIAAIIGQHFLLVRADSTIAGQRIQIEQQVAELEREKLKTATLEKAATERADDTAHLDTMKDDLTNAINAAPKGNAPSPAVRALACERLRQSGNTSSAIYKRQCG